MQQLRAKIQTEVQDQVQQSQRDYYLREQLKAIQKELGEQDEGQRESDELRQKIDAAGMPEDVKKEALKELARLVAHVSHGRRLLADAQLHRVACRAALGQELRRKDRYRQGPGDSGRGPLRAEKGEGPDSGLPERARTEAGHEGTDPVLRRASGRGQDQPGPVDCAGPGPQVPAHLAGRHARRGGDSRPSPHLHRRLAGPDHPEHSPGGNQRPGDHAGRGGQAGKGLPRRPGLGAA